MTFSHLFSIGLSGVNAFATGLESVSANIANSQTAGYKHFETSFAERVSAYQGARANEGAGVIASARQVIGDQGAVTRTATSTNAAILGAGFFVVAPGPASPASEMTFTRSGDYAPDAAGNLVNGKGYYLQGVSGGGDASGGLGGLQTVNVTAAADATLGALLGVTIDEDGLVIGRYATGEERTLFRIPLAVFVNEEGLVDAGDATFRATPDAGDVRIQNARTGAAGAIEGAALEASTVDIGREFSTLIETQRAYATTTRILSTADDLFRTLVETAA